MRRLVVTATALILGAGCARPAAEPASTAAAEAAALTCDQIEEVYSDFGADAEGLETGELAAREALKPDLQGTDVLQRLDPREGGSDRYGLVRDGKLVATVTVVEVPAGGWLANETVRCRL